MMTQISKIVRIPIFLLALYLFLVSGCSPGKVFHTSEDVRQLPLVDYLSALQSDTNCYLIDVRTPFEYQSQHLDQAINISYIGFNFRKKLAKLDRNKTVFLYCETAHRSPYAAKRMQKMGFKRIVDLAGGYKSIRNKVE